ncbi:hypothetical protein [Spiroplasma endosymbiont of Nebria brevicollis]
MIKVAQSWAYLVQEERRTIFGPSTSRRDCRWYYNYMNSYKQYLD